MTAEYQWKEPRPSRAIKTIPKSSHGHFVVRMTINDNDDDPGQISVCGSIAEYRTRMMVWAEPDTVDIIEQVGPFHWTDKKNKGHSHYLDHLVLKADGRRLGLTDKPYARVSSEFADEIAQVSRDGRERGIIDELFLVTEYARDPVKLHNAELMRGCRDQDATADADARAVVDALDREATLRELTDLIGMGPMGFRALVRLIRSEGLTLMQNEKISHNSRVRRGRIST